MNAELDAEDAEGDQFVGIEVAEMLVLHLLGEIEAHILHRHGELLLVVDGESNRLHLARIVRSQAGT